MPTKIKRKIKGITYIYEQTAHYDKEKRQTVRKQVLIGKLDEATGEIIPTRKKRIITTTTTTIFDESDLKKKLIKEIEPLKKSNPEKYEKAIELVEKIPEKTEKTNSELGLYTANPLAIMFNGKATSTLGQAKTRGKIDQLRKKLVVGDVSIFFKNFKEISKLGVGEQKILRYIIAAFTEKNSHGTQNPQLYSKHLKNFKNYLIEILRNF